MSRIEPTAEARKRGMELIDADSIRTGTLLPRTALGRRRRQVIVRRRRLIQVMPQRRGIALSEADFAADESAVLSDDELDAVAGGGKCACVVCGVGKAGDNCKECDCSFGGGGVFEDKVNRCRCASIGGGVDH